MVELNFLGGAPNSSMAIGDMVFYISSPDTNLNSSGFTSGDSQVSANDSAQSSLIYIGNIVSIETSGSGFTVYVQNTTNITGPLINDFIMFAKNNSSSSDLLGYYNKVTFKNDSPKAAELFGISLNYTESSK